MTTELTALLIVTLLIPAQIVLLAILVLFTGQTRWALSQRDIPFPNEHRFVGRLKRCLTNTVEAVAMFAPLVFIAHLTNLSTEQTALGAQTFAAARLAYIPSYLVDLAVIRSLVWGVGLIGLLMLAWPVVQAAWT